MKLTRAQREALWNLFKRGEDWVAKNISPATGYHCKSDIEKYRAFRRTVQPYIGDDCVLVPWCNMWVGIESDGYTHT